MWRFSRLLNAVEQHLLSGASTVEERERLHAQIHEPPVVVTTQRAAPGTVTTLDDRRRRIARRRRAITREQVQRTMQEDDAFQREMNHDR